MHKYLFILLLFSGCSSLFTITEYEIMPDSDPCVEKGLQSRNYCLSEDQVATAACYRFIVNSCRDIVRGKP